MSNIASGATKRALVFGSRGALGSTLVRTLKQRGNWQTVGVDLTSNEDAHRSIVVDPSASFTLQAKHIQQELLSQQEKDEKLKFDAVICLAGGFAMGNLKSKDLIEQCDLMWKVSVQSSIISAQIAALYLDDNGLLILPGAAGATDPSPMTIGYGVAKSAVHHLVRSVAHQKESGMPDHSTTIGIMPSILDTEMNRQSMPKADFSSWTPLQELADKLVEWCENKDTRPKNGSLVRIVTKNKETSYTEE